MLVAGCLSGSVLVACKVRCACGVMCVYLYLCVALPPCWHLASNLLKGADQCCMYIAYAAGKLMAATYTHPGPHGVTQAAKMDMQDSMIVHILALDRLLQPVMPSFTILHDAAAQLNTSIHLHERLA